MIYLDNGATTAMCAEAADDYVKYACENYFNPSALYKNALIVSEAIKRARGAVADTLGVRWDEIYFTASGTESDNTALFGVRLRAGDRLLISALEHSAVINSAMKLKESGVEVVTIPVCATGEIDYDALESELKAGAAMVSVMHASNETGAVNDVERICAAVRRYAPKAVIHSDGVQAMGKIPVRLKETGVDLYSASGHKFHAAKGVGILYVRRGLNIKPLVYGGGQERGLRSATENTSAIISLTHALGLKDKSGEMREKINAVRNAIAQMNIDAVINTPADEKKSLPHILSIALGRVRGEVMLHALSEKGILIGTGSACSTKKGVNLTAQALGLDNRFSGGLIRISVSRYTTSGEINEFVKTFGECYSKLAAFAIK